MSVPNLFPMPVVACLTGPVCGNDETTYASICSLPLGVIKQCIGICPCAVLPIAAGVSPFADGPLSVFTEAVLPTAVDSEAVPTEVSQTPVGNEPTYPIITPIVSPSAADDTILPAGPLDGYPAIGSGVDIADLFAAAGPIQCDHCPTNISPVCGVNGETFDNECAMVCSDISKQCDGACPCDSDS